MNIGCKTDTDTGTSGDWELGLEGLDRMGFGVYDKRMERLAGMFRSGTLRRRTASRHRRLGTTEPNVMPAGVI